MPTNTNHTTNPEDWMNSKWRPMMGWMYMVVCVCDFVLFPILWAALHAAIHVTDIPQWQPLTLQGAGLFHIAMGAVLGIAAMGRTQEKLANVGSTSSPVMGLSPTVPVAPVAPVHQASGLPTPRPQKPIGPAPNAMPEI